MRRSLEEGMRRAFEGDVWKALEGECEVIRGRV